MSQENVPPSVLPSLSPNSAGRSSNLNLLLNLPTRLIVLYVAGLIDGICMFLIGSFGLHTHSTRISPTLIEFTARRAQSVSPDGRKDGAPDIILRFCVHDLSCAGLFPVDCRRVYTCGRDRNTHWHTETLSTSRARIHIGILPLA